MHHPKNPVLGFHGWDETVPQGSVYLVSSFFFTLSLFLIMLFFSLLSLFSWAFFFLSFFFSPTILEPKFVFWELLPTPPTYLPLQPTYLPSTTQPIYLPLPTPPSICAPLHRQSFRTIESLVVLYACHHGFFFYYSIYRFFLLCCKLKNHDNEHHSCCHGFFYCTYYKTKQRAFFFLGVVGSENMTMWHARRGGFSFYCSTYKTRTMSVVHCFVFFVVSSKTTMMNTTCHPSFFWCWSV